MKKVHHSGYALVMTMAVLAVCAVLLGSLINYSSTEIVQVRQQNDSTKAFLIAEAGMEAARAAFVNTSSSNSFASYMSWDNPSTTTDETNAPNKFDFFSASATATATSLRSADGRCLVTMPNNVVFSGGTYTVTLMNHRGHSDNMSTLYAKGDVMLKSVGVYNNSRRTIFEVIRFQRQASQVFDYAYFINNLGWMSGSSIRIDGDVRSNGNFNYSSTPKVDGYTYAAVANGTVGNVVGTSCADTLSNYYTSKTDHGRPGSPADPTNPTTSLYSPGYDGVAGTSVASSYKQQQNPVTMPYIGTTDAYKQMATDLGGYIQYWDTTLNAYTTISSAYDSASSTTSGVETHGANAKYYNPGNGKGMALYLSGDSTHPLIIHGPFVVGGDLVIKGVFQGQGTIIARRNVHIVGNLTAKNAPNYPSTDATPQNTYLNTNINRDMIGLVARGNVVFGNYTTSSSFASYIRPSFTGTYVVDSHDSDNGYVTTASNASYSGQPTFNGDYTQRDKNFDGTSGTMSDGSSRAFYQCTLANSTFSGLCDTRANLTRIDAVMYCNHMVGGDVGSITFNGTMIGRDEATVGQGNMRFCYDERIHSYHGQNVLNIFLPSTLERPVRMVWWEGN